jgi:hypothetical protein
MTYISETQYFIVESHDQPFVDREDWGHIRIRIKDEYKDIVTDRTKLKSDQAIELIRLTMIVGEALEFCMNTYFSIPVIKINYQDMWNRYAKKEWWKPFLHVHIFWRSKDAKYQPRPESVYLPDRSTWFYDKFRPLTTHQIEKLHEYIAKLDTDTKYQR